MVTEADEVVDDDDDEDDEDELPRVVIGTLAGLAEDVEPELQKQHGARPVWFLREQDNELAAVFERLPEGPMAKSQADRILAALRAFSIAHNEALQELIGPAESLRYAFHVDAAHDDVVMSFEDDGFLVVPLEVIYKDPDDQ